MISNKKKFRTPQQDAGWGLIFRLNLLWMDVEKYSPQGAYAQWNFKLDRIWCNLLYRNQVVVKRNAQGDITSMELAEEDIQEKDFLDSKISEARSRMHKAKDEKGVIIKRDYVKAKRDYYSALMFKDIWLRKFMNYLGIYLKETTFDPSRAIYGGD